MTKWQWRVGDGGVDADGAGGGCTALLSLHERLPSQQQLIKTESANAKREEMMLTAECRGATGGVTIDKF
ncbi:hypothetical protein WN944_011821 [Citrus x changshan-huyou]|uniref:Uncharacterized protein n=1 Tax=Citrus x changshan-huyou TaxID=2935761 RepID=A0AAP0R1R5_9ROSI